MSRPSSQQGMTLIVGLIMLTLMTLMAIGSFNIGRVSLEIIGNMQSRNEVLAAANGAVQEAISTFRMVQTPNTVFLNPCVNNNTRCVDINADGINDITVVLSPAPFCLRSQAISNAALNLAAPGAAACAVQVDQTSFGIAGGVSGNSLCANSVWEVNAIATDALTQATITVTEGVAVVASSAAIATSCP